MMHKVIRILCLVVISFNMAFAQGPNVDFSKKPPSLDSLFPKIAAEKNDSARYYLTMTALTISETNPVE
ncbi:MAG: hypothetical protein RLZZ546_1, partial [Bacteroidota bacterium]